MAPFLTRTPPALFGPSCAYTVLPVNHIPSLAPSAAVPVPPAPSAHAPAHTANAPPLARMVFPVTPTLSPSAQTVMAAPDAGAPGPLLALTTVLP